MVLVFIPLRLYTSRPTLAIFVQSNSVGARVDDAGKGGPLWSPASWSLCSPVGERDHTPSTESRAMATASGGFEGDRKGPHHPTPLPPPLLWTAIPTSRISDFCKALLYPG